MLRWFFQDTPIKGKLSLITLAMTGLGATTAVLSGALMLGLDKAAKASGAAELAGLQTKKGALKAGLDADIVVRTLSSHPNALRSKHCWQPQFSP